MSAPGDIRDAVKEVLEPETSIVVAYLFGSAARGTAGPLSDVDVGVLLAGTTEREPLMGRRASKPPLPSTSRFKASTIEPMWARF